MDFKQTQQFIEEVWAYGTSSKSIIVDSLEEYIKIPNDSPGFDPNWAANGHMDKAVSLFVQAIDQMKAEWGKKGIKTDDITTKILGGPQNEEKNAAGKRRTPLIVIEIPAFGEPKKDQTVLLYGHLDKQPGVDDQWANDLGPRKPVIRDGKLYGRGGADDGYAMFSAFSALMSLRAQNAPHARSFILIESCEESGSSDLEHYINALSSLLGNVTLIVCLDSGALDYDHLWFTTSLRGAVRGTLNIRVAKSGIHSGDASGIVPSSFRIFRQLLSRLEDENTGEITPDVLKVEIPDYILQQAQEVVDIVGDSVFRKYPFINDNVKPAGEDLKELVLNRTWRTQLSTIGIDGIPAPKNAGNVMLPYTTAVLSFRLPPTLDAQKAGAAIKAIFEKDKPYNAEISFSVDDTGNGFAAPKAAAWLENAIKDGAKEYFHSSPAPMGEGGSIPFMNMLREKFPNAQFLVTGLLGPASNAHGPDEFLNLPYAQKLTMCVAKVLAEHHKA